VESPRRKDKAKQERIWRSNQKGKRTVTERKNLFIRKTFERDSARSVPQGGVYSISEKKTKEERPCCATKGKRARKETLIGGKLEGGESS